MSTLVKLPYNAIEVLHQDYNILSSFVHVQESETESLLEYSDNHIENLENALFDYLDKEDRDKVEKLLIELSTFIKTGIEDIERRAKSIRYDN